MRLVFVLLFCVAATLAADDDKNDYDDKKDDIGDKKDGKEDFKDKPFLPEYAKDDERIYRPCPRFRLDCIRHFLKDHSACKVVHGEVPDPFIRPMSTIFLSFFNLTVTQLDVHLYNLDGKVTEFYVNRESDVVVLQVTYEKLYLKTRRDIFRYHRPGNVPAETESETKVDYPKLTTTTVFRHVDHLDLRYSDTTGLAIIPAKVVTSPSAGEHPDPIVKKTFLELVAGSELAIKEALLTSAPFYAATYIQHTLCDFGLKPL